MYENLTADATCIAFYDVKNAKLCRDVEGRNPLNAEPIVDEEDLGRFVQTAQPLLQPGRDILWVMAGRIQFPVYRVLLDLQHCKDAAIRLLAATTRPRKIEQH